MRAFVIAIACALGFGLLFSTETLSAPGGATLLSTLPEANTMAEKTQCVVRRFHVTRSSERFVNRRCGRVVRRGCTTRRFHVTRTSERFFNRRC